MLTTMPSGWGGVDLGDRGLMLVMEGADRNRCGGGLFPQILRKDLHGVRSVIEAYSRTATIAPVEHSVMALLLQNAAWGGQVRVNGTDRIILDRWN